jgi:hypothetical protein
MTKEFIPYIEALALKELGFNKECFGYYTGDKMHLVIRPAMSRTNIPDSYVVTAPLYQQAFRWFRKKHGLFIRPDFDVNYIDELDEFETTYFFSILEMEESLVGFKPLGRLSSEKTYEEAELECLKKLIEIVKNK